VTITYATPEEKQTLGLVEPDGMKAHAWIAREDGELVGHIALSEGLGQLFGHDTAYWGEDKTGAARLWLTARKAGRELGYKSVTVHFQEGEPMKEFWVKQGFQFVCEVYRGEI
jgi:hypothetical protein